MLIIKTEIAITGVQVAHGVRFNVPARLAWLIVAPHSGEVGETPRPKNPNEAARNIA